MMEKLCECHVKPCYVKPATGHGYDSHLDGQAKFLLVQYGHVYCKQLTKCRGPYLHSSSYMMRQFFKSGSYSTAALISKVGKTVIKICTPVF